MLLRLFFSLLLVATALAQDLQHPAAFPKVAIKGVARPDAGYFVQEFLVNGKAYPPDRIDAAGRAALLASGWKSADLKKRRQLALDWCTQVAMVGNVVLWEAPEDFPGPKSSFHPPVAVQEADGKIHVRFHWFRPGGNVRVAVMQYSLGHWTVDPDGQIRTL